jgi:hypothetical protein
MTAEEFAETLTGFEEIAIEKHMGLDVYTESKKKPVLAMRAMVFVDQTRQGLDAAAAKDAALGMTVKDVQSYFNEDDEVTPDTPETESGKDDSTADDEPTD